MKKQPDWYMFERHSKETVAGWVSQLRYFYYIRAWGGHANDGNAFKAGILFTDRTDLEEKLHQLGIVPGSISLNDPQPVPGQSYPGTEFAKFKTAVFHFPDLEQTGHVNIAGQNVFVWISDTAITFSVSGTADNNNYEVSAVDLQACLKIEEVFNQLQWQSWKDTSMEQSISCVSALRYPELFV